MKDDSQRTSAEISRKFEHFYPDLLWEINISKTSPWAFCVSAGGNRDLFARVKQVVADAPELPGWKIQAFRPRGKLTAQIEMGGLKLGYDDVWCSVSPFDGGVDVTLWIRGLEPQTEKILSRAALVLLDNAVGEYDATMRIKRLWYKPLPTDVVPYKQLEYFPIAFPLRDMPKFFDNELID